MDYKNLLLICASGITTGLLVRNMEKEIKAKNIPIHIYAAPSITLNQIIKDKKIDGVLIGPQIEHELNDISRLLNANKISFDTMNKESYELLDSTSILEAGKRVLEL